MISNKNISNLSLQKMWDKFNKMNDVILVLMSTNWIQQEDGTFTNTIPYAGFSSEELYEIDLYDDGNLSDAKITEYEEYITEFNINDGELVAIAKTAPTQTISIVVKGQFMADDVTIGNWEQVEGSINQLETKIDALNNLIPKQTALTIDSTDFEVVRSGTSAYYFETNEYVFVSIYLNALTNITAGIAYNIPSNLPLPIAYHADAGYYWTNNVPASIVVSLNGEIRVKSYANVNSGSELVGQLFYKKLNS